MQNAPPCNAALLESLRAIGLPIVVPGTSTKTENPPNMRISTEGERGEAGLDGTNILFYAG